MLKHNGYALVYCSRCRRRQRVEVGEEPEGWVRVTTLRGKPVETLCPKCARKAKKE
jgi:hypothetical protein